jgi:glutathione-regulated potassium-efflux system ancillary protein KefC/glutathione-regulated potassium-efflux system protein KefB
VTLAEVFAFLAAACVAVPLFRMFGFGSVLGYLAAGVAIGPYGLGAFRDVDSVLHAAEFGVVMLLFIIGLELKPSRLWIMRRAIFGLGTTQVMISAAGLGVVAWLLGQDPSAAIVIGLGLALSSTAFVLQMLAERKELNTQYGRSTFAILLFQDLAVIPILAVLALLAPETPEAGGAGIILLKLGSIIALVVGGRYLLRPAFRLAAAGGQEIFTAAALLTVVGSAYLMYLVDISMALGAFIAGVLLAESEFRHQLEAEIEPFKGLLLGLFFVAVGMSAELSLLAAEPLTILALTVILLTFKGAVLFVLGKIGGLPTAVARDMAIAIPQGGEFAFVIFGTAVAKGLLADDIADLLILVVTVSMIATPLLVLTKQRLFRQDPGTAPSPAYDTIDDGEPRIIIAGMGRFAQIIARILHVRGIPFTAIESDLDQLEIVRRFGNTVYFGDVTDLGLLRAAHADHATLAVIAVDGVEASLRVVENFKTHYPRLKLFARARDRHHAHRLMDLGVDLIIRETYVSSLEMATAVLESLGDGPEQARRTVARFRDSDEALLAQEHAVLHDESKHIQTVAEATRELEALFEADPCPPDPAAARQD